MQDLTVEKWRGPTNPGKAVWKSARALCESEDLALLARAIGFAAN
jgi:hypothetical protein